MEPRQERADALMYRTTTRGNLMFCWPPLSSVSYYRWLGWRLLVRQDEVQAAFDDWRSADIEETRRLDEQGPGGR
jgi:hypothetical protein